MTDINEFLRQRTLLCERQHARITPAQCQVCRDRGDAFCTGCSGLVPTYPLSAVMEDEVSKKQVKECKMCHRQMEIAGRGMCGRCYAVELKREKSSVNAPPLKPVKAAETVAEPVGSVAEKGTDAEWENAGWVKQAVIHSEPAQIIPENIPFAPIDDYPADPPPAAEWVPVDTTFPRAETMRQLLKSSNRQLIIPDSIAQEWEQLGLNGEHVLGLMELHVNGELAIRRYL